jgi:uncharacterized membrane protein
MKMKKIFQRLINLISVVTILATLSHLMDSLKDAGSALLIGTGIVLTLNYVFFGIVTVWHKTEMKKDEQVSNDSK